MKVNKSQLKKLILKETEETMKPGEDSREIENLLQIIADKLDKLSDIDTSLDTLTGVVAGVDPEVINLGQQTRGRLALSAPHDFAHAHKLGESKGSIKVKVNKFKPTKTICEGPYGGSIPDPKPSPTPDFNMAPKVMQMNPEGLEEMKRQLEPQIIEIFKSMAIDKSNAYEIITLIQKDLENQLGNFDYEYELTPPTNPSLNEGKKHSVRVRVRSSKGVGETE